MDLKTAQPALDNILMQNQKLLQKVVLMAEEDLRVIIASAKNFDELIAMLSAYTQSNVLVTPKTQSLLLKFQNNVGTAYTIGMNTGKQTPFPQIRLMKQAVTDSSLKYITKLDDEIKRGMANTINRSMEINKVQPIRGRIQAGELVNTLSNKFQISKSRADTIARTETMHAGNLSAWAQNKAEGAEYFIVDSRPACCYKCKGAYAGKVFSIDETDKVPPYHPRCACVALFFDEKKEAKDFSKRVVQRNEAEIKKYEKKGLVVPKDGTGPVFKDVKK